MQGKICIEEHIEAPDFSATGSHDFTESNYFNAVQDRLQEYKKRLEDMDAMGIEKTILNVTQPGIEGIPDAKKAVDMAKRMNDHIAEFFVANNPKRFFGFAAVPMQNPKEAAKELERAVKELGFKGALINGYSNTGDMDHAQYLDEAPVWEFWEKAEELDVPVYLHPRIPLPNQQRIYQGYEGLLGSAWGFGQETATHAVRLMLSGLFDRFPKLNVVLGHLGETLPFTLPRLDHRLRHQRQETHGKHKMPAMYYFQHNFYVTTSGVFRSQALLNTMLELGSDRILFSVDYPYEAMTELAPWFDTCPISENDRIKIGRTNAERLFKL
jgi:2,3-dihydroxybenzoate decarboxylase